MNPFRVLRRTARTWPAEHSVALRVSAAGAVCIAIAACAAQAEVPLWFGAVAAAFVCAGGVFSYRRRTRPFPFLKVLLGAATLGVFAWFFVTVSADAATGQLGSVEAPLAVLFTAMQVAHAFDMPSRRDLRFSLAGSATLMAVAGAQAIDLSFGLYVVLWAVLALVGLHASWSSMAGGAPARPLPVVASTAVALLVAAMLVAFLPAPRPPRLSVTPGIGGTAAASSAAQPARIVPARAADQFPAPASGPTGVGGFLGFAGQLDTALRPGLGNEVVFRVSADRPTYWVAETFDSWSGRSWTEIASPPAATRGVQGTDKQPAGSATLTGGPPFLVAPEVVSALSPQPSGAPVTPPESGVVRATAEPDYQTFYIAAPASNLLLHADQATAVWIPTRHLRAGTDDTISTVETLGAGSVYSVVSTVATPSEAALSKANGAAGLTPAIARQDLKLPHAYPRVAALARRITAHDPTVIAKIATLERWIGAHTEYTLDIPPLSRGQDTVVQFLCGTRRGFCEQISTSLAVMLRTLGIPAREAVGYVPGTFDPITGLYDEQAKDAHAWVQVWFPGYGWQSFDPTAYVPIANPSTAFTIGHDLLAAIRHVPVIPTAPVVAAVLLGALALVWRRRRPRTWSAKVTRELERAARRAGIQTEPGSTLGSLARALDAALDDPFDDAVDDPFDAALDASPHVAQPDTPARDSRSVRVTAHSSDELAKESRPAAELAAVAAAAAWGDGEVDARPNAGRHYVRDARRLRRSARHHARR